MGVPRRLVNESLCTTTQITGGFDRKPAVADTGRGRVACGLWRGVLLAAPDISASAPAAGPLPARSIPLHLAPPSYRALWEIYRLRIN